MTHKISSLVEFMDAIKGKSPSILEIQTSLLFPYSIILPPGFSIKGVDMDRCILSFNSGDGIGLTVDNEVSNLTIMTSPMNRAIYTLSDSVDLGTLNLNNLTITGQVQILTRIGTKKVHLIADNIDIVSCDARRYSEQPQKYGVNVYQGAFTVYNFNGDEESIINATLTNISIGRKNAPVIGSGIFICGFGDTCGQVIVDKLTTFEVHSNGMLPYGTADMITAAIFIVYGAHVASILHKGPITTYGVNDMVLDAWGKVDEWVVEQPITSYGPSGIGFVNFGTVGYFEAKSSIETFGLGARGFNQYDGTVNKAIFNSIITHGDGSIGIQVSKPVGTIEVVGQVITYGSIGQTLVKGVIMTLPANGVSIKTGGELKELIVKGGIITNGNKVTSLEIDGTIEEIFIDNGIIANGLESIGVVIAKGGKSLPNNITVEAKQGVAMLTKS